MSVTKRYCKDTVHCTVLYCPVLYCTGTCTVEDSAARCKSVCAWLLGLGHDQYDREMREERGYSCLMELLAQGITANNSLYYSSVFCTISSS